MTEGGSMYVVRDVFRCKPGKAKAVAEKFQKTVSSMKELDGGYREIFRVHA